MPEADDLLREWAGAVADGHAVDWEAAASDAVPESRLRHLRTLAAIARACRMPPAPPAPAAGVLFRWCHLEIRERIGQGVYGEVFRGWDTKLEREVAVKFLSAEAAAAVPHVLQEGRHLARVRHPGVVMVFGAEEQDGRVGIWMEYVHGHTLEEWMERGTFGSHEALLIGIDLCRALAAVHGANLVHRDVKTRNVVREDTGRIVLMDFGAGVDFRSESHESHEVAGTPIYLAPEVLRGEPAGPQSDLYGLGVLLYRLVTRSYPFSGATLEALRDAHERGALRPLSEARPDLSVPFRRVVERALAPDPAVRFASAGQMEAALAAALEEPRRAARRRAGVVAVSAAVVVAALGIALAKQRTRMALPASSTTPPTVAVADVVNELRDPEMDALSGMLTTSLDQARGLRVLTGSRLSDILSATGRPLGTRIDAPLGLEVCRRERAAALLVPSVRRVGEHYRVALEALDPRRGRRMFAASAIAADKDRFSAAIDTLSQRVRAVLERGPAGSGAAQPVAQITTPSLSAYSRYDRAERLIDRLDLPAARTQLEQALSLDSTFALAHARLAYVCWWLNDVPCERTHLAAAFARMDRVPERHRFHVRAQGAMADRQGLEVARSILLEMERYYPDDKEMLYDIGDYSSHLSEFPQAIQYLEKVIAMDPGFARALQHMTRVYRDLGRREPYLGWAKRYAATDSVWDSYVLLGNAQVAAGDPESGIATLSRGRTMTPEHGSDFTMFIARSRFFQGRLAEGRREVDGLVGAASTRGLRAGALRERALGRIHQGAYESALADLEEAAELAGHDRDRIGEAIARNEAAVLHMVGFNDPAASSRQVRQCASLEDAITYRDTYFHYWPYWGNRFKLDLLGGDLGAAEALAKQKFAPDKWYGPYVEAYLHAARGQCAQAAAAASRVLEWGPVDENIPLLYFLARCQLEHGDAAATVESLLRLQGLYSHLTLGTPYVAAGLRLLGEAYERRGDAESAARSYTKLLEQWREGDPALPDRVEVRRRLERLRTPLAAAEPEP